MEPVVYTLQEFTARAAGSIYLLTIGGLAVLGLFWHFLSARDEDIRTL